MWDVKSDTNLYASFMISCFTLTMWDVKDGTIRKDLVQIPVLP